MSRYIDADAFDDTVQTLNEQGWNITRFDYKRMDRVLFEMPTADVVEVIRCKDCKHSKMADYIPAKCPYFCKLMANCHSGDFFCSMGEEAEQ